MAGVSRSAKTFTPKQGQYLAYIHLYTRLHRRPPAETDMQQYFRVNEQASSEGNQGQPAASKCSLIPSACQSYFDPGSTGHNHCAEVLGADGE
jgi:hypothetical protein